ncbi:MAG TPA: dihydroorotate dehydrogenase [Deltaproteobacteria bacterium]|nr:dihydroorotate dehydrogenase [Deltaproteobacteria bacterium]
MDTTVVITPSLTLKNPIMSASGTFAYGEEFSEIFDLSLMGAVVTKGLSLNPKKGNPTPRVFETPCGLINAIGLENIGVDAFVREKLPFLRQFDVPIIANFFGSVLEEYEQTAEKLNIDGISALEMNVSCPNVKKGGIEFGKDPGTLFSLISKVRSVTDKPLLIKLSPMVTDICEMALAAQEAGADAITCANTIPAMAIDEETRRPVLGNITGGLSGPAIKPVSLKLVWDVHKCVRIPIIASGGIVSYRDVIQFILAGATAVEIGSAALRDPLCFSRIIRDIEDYLARHSLERISDLIGKLDVS